MIAAHRITCGGNRPLTAAERNHLRRLIDAARRRRKRLDYLLELRG